jgi:hypothetical protein
MKPHVVNSSIVSSDRTRDGSALRGAGTSQ